MNDFFSSKRYSERFKYYFFQILIILFFLAFMLYRIKDYDMPASTTDELGYLAFPAQVVGFDWKDLMQYTDYYSKGFGLLLIPLYAIFSGSPWLLYKAVVMLNCILVILTFKTCLYLASIIFPYWKKNQCLLGCCVVTFYPSIFFYSHVALPETLLIFLFWLELLCLVKFDLNKHIRWLVFFSLLLGYMFIVHQRTLGVCIAAIIAILFLLIKNKIPVQYVVIIFALLIVSFALWKIMQDVHYSYIGGANELNQKNLSVFGINSFFLIILECIKNIEKYFFAILGRIYYFLIVGNLPFFIGAVYLFEKIIKISKKIFKKGVYKKFDSAIIFLFFSILITFAEAATGGVAISRLDTPVYSRYIENVMYPLILLGVYLVAHYKMVNLKTILVYVMSIFIITPLVYHMMLLAKQDIFSIDSSVGLGAFFDKRMPNQDYLIRLFTANIVAITVAVLIYIFTKLKKTVKFRGFLKKSCIFVVLGVYWISLSQISENKFFITRNEIYTKYIDNILPILDSDKNANIIYIRSTDKTCMAAKYIQFLIPDRTIHVIDISNVDKECLLPNTFIIMYSQEEAQNTLNNKYQLLCSQSDINIYKIVEE